MIVLSFFLALGIRSFIAEARYIDDMDSVDRAAMLPTLQINDRLIINKLSYNFQNPQRGDIVLFSSKRQNFKKTLLRRVIGLPGETVEMKDGLVYINGQPLQEKYVKDRRNYGFDRVTVPSNQYLVVSDNRKNIFDSHYWHFVPHNNIIGRAVGRFWPLNRVGEIYPVPHYPTSLNK